MTDSEHDEKLSELLALGRADAPAADLGARVLDSVSYRARLVEAEPRARDGSALGNGVFSGRVLALAGGFALAASLLVWLSTRTAATVDGSDTAEVELAPEPMLSSAAPRAGTGEVRTPSPAEDPCLQAVVAGGNAPLIDDFEDGDDALLPLEQRAGLWRWVRDTDAPGTAPALLPVPRQPSSAKNQLALRVKGDRLREWGATIEFVFESKCYDASAYAGIAFQARGANRIYLAPREVGVMPVSAGGLCVDDCHNNHVKQISLGPDWQTFEVRFDEVEQRGYDRPPLDPKRLHSVAFLVRPEDTPYDVWIDDVRFIPR
jgi:hypothetical protein